MDFNSYMLGRDSKESERLDLQHRLWRESLGYLISPRIEPNLPQNAQIADLATGTGIFLLDASQKLSQSKTSTFHGFDISTAQFPAKENIPFNFRFHQHDFKKPFPSQFQQIFDLIHVRLTVLAMEYDDFSRVLTNITQILKPGGWIQWAEADFISVTQPLKSKPDAKVENLKKLAEAIVGICGDRIKACPWKLVEAFEGHVKRGQLEMLDTDVVGSDRLGEEWRGVATGMEIGVYRSMMITMKEEKEEGKKVDGVDGVDSGNASVNVNGASDIENTNPSNSLNGKKEEKEDDVERIVRKMQEEVESGGYVRWNIHLFTARKPLV